MNDKAQSIAAKMKLFRALNNMTQEELSIRSGIDYSQIRRYETGARNPKYEQLQSMSSALGIGVTEFVDLRLETVGDLMSLLLKMDMEAEMNWDGKKDKNGNYDPSSIKFSFNNKAINESLAAYLKYRDAIKTGKRSETVITDEDGNELTVEQLRGRLIINDTKIKKPEA